MRVPAGVLVLGLIASVNAAQVSPVEKVLELMTNLRDKAINDADAEEVQHATFMQWCQDTDQAKAASISDASEAIEAAEASIQENTIRARELFEEIQKHDFERSKLEENKVAATSIRTEENTVYNKQHQEFTGTLDALRYAISSIKSAQDDIARKAAESKAESGVLADNQADAASGHGGGIVEKLQELEDEFRRKMRELEKEEANNLHAYEQFMQLMDGEIKAQQAHIDRKTKARGKALDEAGQAKAEKANQETLKKTDEDYKAELVEMCSAKDRAFAARRKLRVEEAEALKQAIDIISNRVAGREGHGQNLLQIAADPLREQAVTVLNEKGAKIHSHRLAMLAEAIAANPFAKVKKMIQDMIFKLKQEAREEAEQHGWCTAELAGNKETREGKSAAVEELQAEVDELSANIQQTKEENAELTKQIEGLNKAMLEADENRRNEKADNTHKIAEAQAAQEAVAEALTILREFYSKAAKAANFVQTTGPADDAPASFDTNYYGNQDSNTGVVGMLETIQGDFARTESDTKIDEETSAREHKKFMQESKVDLATKETSHQMNEEKIGRLTNDLDARKEDLSGVQSELDAANAYYEKLKPTCVVTPVSYEERVAMREAEVQSLKEAQEILAASADAAAGAA